MRLFKYISIDDCDSYNIIENILKDNYIKFSQVKNFNDPFELKPNVIGLADEKLIDEVFESTLFDEYKNIQDTMTFNQFKSLIYNSGGLENLKDIVFNSNYNNFTKNTLYEKNNELMGILSLTTKKDNLLMWAHYANSHKGFVIEFNSENEFFNQKLHNEDFLRCLQKVIYSKKRPKKYITDFDDDISSLFLTKSIEWQYEDEYRMFMPLEKADKKENGISLFKFPKTMIKSIYIGCNTTTSNKDKIISIIKDNNLKDISVYDSFISEEDYKLNFKETKYTS